MKSQTNDWESESEEEGEGQKHHWLLIRSSSSCSVCFFNVSSGFQSIDEKIRDDLNRFFSTAIDVGSSICNNCFTEYSRFRKESVVYPFIFKNFGEDLNSKRRKINPPSASNVIHSPPPPSPHLLSSPPLSSPPQITSQIVKKEKKSKKEKKEKKLSKKQEENLKLNAKRKQNPTENSISNSSHTFSSTSHHPNLQNHPNYQGNIHTNPQILPQSSISVVLDKKTKKARVSNPPVHYTTPSSASNGLQSVHSNPPRGISNASNRLKCENSGNESSGSSSPNENRSNVASPIDETSSLPDTNSNSSLMSSGSSSSSPQSQMSHPPHHSLLPCCAGNLHGNNGRGEKAISFNPALQYGGIDFSYIGALKVQELQDALKKYNASGKGSKSNLQQKLIKLLHQNYTQPSIQSSYKPQSSSYPNSQLNYLNSGGATNYYATTTTNENGEIQQILVPMNYSSSEANSRANSALDAAKTGGITIAHGANGSTTTTINRGRVVGPSTQSVKSSLPPSDPSKSKSKYVIKSQGIVPAGPGGVPVKGSADPTKAPYPNQPGPGSFYLIQPNTMSNGGSSSETGATNSGGMVKPSPNQQTLYATPSAVDPKTGVQYYHLYPAPNTVNSLAGQPKRNVSITSPPKSSNSEKVANPYSNPGGTPNYPVGQRMQVTGPDGKTQYLQIIPVSAARMPASSPSKPGAKVSSNASKGTTIAHSPGPNGVRAGSSTLLTSSGAPMNGPVRIVKGIAPNGAIRNAPNVPVGSRPLNPNGTGLVSSVPITSAPAGTSVPLITSSLQISNNPNNPNSQPLSPNSTIVHHSNSMAPPSPRMNMSHSSQGGHTISHNVNILPSKSSKPPVTAGINPNMKGATGGNTIAHTGGRIVVNSPVRMVPSASAEGITIVHPSGSPPPSPLHAKSPPIPNNIVKPGKATRNQVNERLVSAPEALTANGALQTSPIVINAPQTGEVEN